MGEKKRKRLDEMTEEEEASVDEKPDGDHGTHVPDMIEDEESGGDDKKSDRDK